MKSRFQPSIQSSVATAAFGAVFLCGLQLLAPAGAWAGDDWLTLTDETSTRLVAAAGVGAEDPEEKDYAWGDLDQDGDTDLVVVRKEPFTCNQPGFPNVLLMNEDGVLTDRTSTLAPAFLDDTNDRDVEVVDVDGDGWLDIVTAGTFEEQPRILINLGESGGVWQGLEWQPERLPFLESAAGWGPFFCGLAVGDVTGDDRPDLYFTDYGGQPIAVLNGPGGPSNEEGLDLDDVLLVNVMIEGEWGHFQDQTASRLTADMRESLFGTDVEIGDMNGDGFPDLIKNEATGFQNLECSTQSAEVRREPAGATEGGGSIPNPTVAIFYNDGFGDFTNGAGWSAAQGEFDAPYAVAVADFTQDDRLDLFVIDDVFDRYLVNTGNDGQNQAMFDVNIPNSPKTNGFGGNAHFADMDGDGILDILVADVDPDIPGYSRRMAILQGAGTPPDITYSDPLGNENRPWTPTGTFDVAPIDIDGDGALDLVIGTWQGTTVFMAPNRTVFEDGFESGDTDNWDNSVE